MKWDGAFHPIEVKVNIPAARVRSRTGYFALPDPRVSAQTVRADISQTLSSQLEATGIGMLVDVQAAPEHVLTANLPWIFTTFEWRRKATVGPAA